MAVIKRPITSSSSNKSSWGKVSSDGKTYTSGLFGGTTINLSNIKNSSSKNSTSSSSSSSKSSSNKSSSGSSSSSSKSSGSVDSTGYYSSGKTVQVAAGGNAPAGTQIGDTVVTAGGSYRVVKPNTAGATYNPTNNLWSVKISNNTSTSGGGSSGTSALLGSGVTSPSANSTTGPSGYYAGTDTGYIDRGANQSQGTYGYTSEGTFYDQIMSQADLAAINSYKAQYEQAKARGDTAAMLAANNAANELRAKYGYYGGTDGSLGQKIELTQDTMPQIGLPVYEAQTGAVNNTYDAAQKTALAALQTAYDNAKLEAEAAKAKIPGLYQQQANLIGAQAAVNQANNWEMAAYSGLNRGSGSQMALSQANQLQSDMSALRTAEANAMQDAENQLTSLYINYQNSIAEAVANNEYERAAALLQEYRTAAQSVVDVAQAQASLNLSIAEFNRDTNRYNTSWQFEQDNTSYQRQVELAEALAQFGDFSGYKALGLSDAQIAELENRWWTMLYS